jgi:hypothetical protein
MSEQIKKEKILHGNRAKIDPKKQIESLYATNRVTLSDHKAHETPIVEDDDVEYSRRFVEENEK